MRLFRFQSTNYFLLESSRDDSLLAFDAGWPCSLHGYAHTLKTTGLRFRQIKWAMVSHFHIDHAGLIGNFQDAGIKCFVFENQIETIAVMEELIGRKYRDYRKIRKDGLVKVQTCNSRSLLESFGIKGEVIITSGHSDDSISLITDSHEALVGDLCPISQIMDDDARCHESWNLIRQKGGKHIYPSHAEPFTLD